MAETINELEQIPGPSPADIGSVAVAHSLQAETDQIFTQIAEELDADRLEGQQARTIGVLAAQIKEDFQRSLLQHGERAAIELAVRERSARRTFRVFRSLGGEEETLQDFQTTYREAETVADNMDKQELVELLDQYGDSPILRTFLSVRNTSSYDTSATKLVRTSILLMHRYGY